VTVDRKEAAAMRADVEGVVAKVGRSRIYRCAAPVIILWGMVDLIRTIGLVGRPYT
jgi:hypothetical protein